MEKQYVCIDLKSFYASVECVARGLNPMTTNLVVADISRTEKTICLAVTPSLKAHGISGRARLFEVIQQLKAINAKRQLYAPGRKFTGSSSDDTELRQNLKEKGTAFLRYLFDSIIRLQSLRELLLDGHTLHHFFRRWYNILPL